MSRKNQQAATGEYTIHIGVGEACSVYLLDTNGEPVSRVWANSFRSAKRQGRKLKKLAEQGITVWG